jgi:hypothetical protein
MTKALRKSTAAVRKASKQPKEPAWATWADRFPLGTAAAFADLVVKTDDNGRGPLAFVFGTVVSCLTDEDLERFRNAVLRIRDLAEEEQKRRRLHGVPEACIVDASS